VSKIISEKLKDGEVKVSEKEVRDRLQSKISLNNLQA
jgi:hypothetical protein